MPNFSKEDLEILRRHVSNTDSNIYLIHNLPPEVVAVLFAYVSRSPLSFRENLLKLIKGDQLDMRGVIDAYSYTGLDYSAAREKAKQFHEKWVVGYGHSSVAEHAVASIAIEDVSILATKVLEDNRLASYTEKSTRYQVFDRNRYYKPKKLIDSELGALYIKTCDFLFDTYTEIFPKMMDFVREQYKLEKEPLVKAKACDIVRCILPAATLTNLAMTANARVLEHAMTKLLSHPLDEMREIGQKMKGEVLKIIPTLVKYADYNPYMAETGREMEEVAKSYTPHTDENQRSVVLVEYDKDAENKVVAAILYRYLKQSYSKIKQLVDKMEQKERERIIDSFLGKIGKFDRPLRELEHIYYTFDILVDYGAFRDIQRHRMCTQTSQELSTRNGFTIPDEIVSAGFKEQFLECMKQSAETFEELVKQFPKEAQYVVPLAYRKRTLITWNLRELHHFIKLRSGKEGHISYRRVAWDVYKELKKVHPLLAKHIKVDFSEG
jgi:thymidylate synthase ThyX